MITQGILEPARADHARARIYYDQPKASHSRHLSWPISAQATESLYS